MSDTSETDARTAAATEPSATETQTATQPETSSEGRAVRTTNEAAPGAETTPPTDRQSTDSKPPPPDPRDRAIRQLAYEQREARRQLQALRDEQTRRNPPDPNAPLTQADVDRLITERAQTLIEQREAAARSDHWVSAGNADYADFTARCNQLADMGAGENRAFMAALGEIEAGHKVVAALAEDPAETARILRLAPIPMALELGRMSARLAAAPPPPPKPVSQAPAPIRPLATAARAETNPETMSSDDYMKWWNKRTRG